MEWLEPEEGGPPGTYIVWAWSYAEKPERATRVSTKMAGDQICRVGQGTLIVKGRSARRRVARMLLGIGPLWRGRGRRRRPRWTPRIGPRRSGRTAGIHISLVKHELHVTFRGGWRRKKVNGAFKKIVLIRLILIVKVLKVCLSSPFALFSLVAFYSFRN